MKDLYFTGVKGAGNTPTHELGTWQINYCVNVIDCESNAYAKSAQFDSCTSLQTN